MTKYNILHIPSGKLYQRNTYIDDILYINAFIEKIKYIRFVPNSFYCSFHTIFSDEQADSTHNDWIKVSSEEFEIVEINEDV